MTNVILAECHGQVWLVSGDEHVDEILNGRVPEGSTVEYITLENRGAVIDMWMTHSAEADENGMPWMINPLLLGRLRGAFNPGVRSIDFAAWSVLLDGVAQQILAETASWLAVDAGRRVRLRQFAPDVGEPGKADLQRLRGQLAMGVLMRAGVTAERMTEEMAPASSAADLERMDVIEEPAG